MGKGCSAGVCTSTRASGHAGSHAIGVLMLIAVHPLSRATAQPKAHAHGCAIRRWACCVGTRARWAASPSAPTGRCWRAPMSQVRVRRVGRCAWLGMGWGGAAAAGAGGDCSRACGRLRAWELDASLSGTPTIGLPPMRPDQQLHVKPLPARLSAYRVGCGAHLGCIGPGRRWRRAQRSHSLGRGRGLPAAGLVALHGRWRPASAAPR